MWPADANDKRERVSMANPTQEFRDLLLSFRQGRLIEIGAIETYLDLERTKIPNKHKKSTVYMRKKADTIKNEEVVKA